MAMMILEEKIQYASQQMNELIVTLDRQMSFVPPGVSITDAQAAKTLDLKVFSGPHSVNRSEFSYIMCAKEQFDSELLFLSF